MENILVILGSFLCLAYGRLNPLWLAFSWLWPGGDLSKSPEDGWEKSTCGPHFPPALGPLLAMQTPRPPITSLFRAPLWLQPLTGVPVKHPFLLLSLQAWGSHGPPDAGLSDLPHQFWFLRPFPTPAGHP